jgi:hypothetical protein
MYRKRQKQAHSIPITYTTAVLAAERACSTLYGIRQSGKPESRLWESNPQRPGVLCWSHVQCNASVEWNGTHPCISKPGPSFSPKQSWHATVAASQQNGSPRGGGRVGDIVVAYVVCSCRVDRTVARFPRYVVNVGTEHLKPLLANVVGCHVSMYEV